MITIEEFKESNVDNTPYTNEQLEFVLHIYNETAWPWECIECENMCVTKSKILNHDVYILNIDDMCYMTTLPADIIDHRSIYEDAQGSVLLTGLGLGLGVVLSCKNPKVDCVTVVENSAIVLSCIEPMLSKILTKPVRFIEFDANRWVPDMRFDFAYIDHAYQRADSERYIPYSDIVVNWYDERIKLEETWR